MAVSGNQISNFSGTIFKESADDSDLCCGTCFTAGQHGKSLSCCVYCQKYLCINCFTAHQRSKSSRCHQQLETVITNSHGVPQFSCVSSEKCSVHKDRLVTYFCPKHNKLGCYDCVLLHHVHCKVDYIPGKCAGIRGSTDNRKTIKLLNKKLTKVKVVEEKALQRNKEINRIHTELIKEMDQFEKKINYKHQQRKQMQAEIEKKKSIDIVKLRDVLDSCSNISSEISMLLSNLKKKERKETSQTDIDIKRAMTIIESDEVRKVDEILDQTNMQYIFEPTKDLNPISSQPASFGKLSLSASLAIPGTQLIEKDSMSVNTFTDTTPCSIIGCAVISSKKVVLADHDNNKLKVLDSSSKCVLEEKRLDASPWDIALLPGDQIAVTLPERREFLIMGTTNKLLIVNAIGVNGQCRGISYRRDCVYAVCQKPNSVVILDIKTNVCKTTTLDDDLFIHPLYIAVNEDSGLIYISDWDSRSIVGVTGKGEVSAKVVDLPFPRGISMLPCGSLLVCCENGTVYHVTGDLSKTRRVLDRLESPQSICYDAQKQFLFIGGVCKHLEVLRVKYYKH